MKMKAMVRTVTHIQFKRTELTERKNVERISMERQATLLSKSMIMINCQWCSDLFVLLFLIIERCNWLPIKAYSNVVAELNSSNQTISPWKKSKTDTLIEREKITDTSIKWLLFSLDFFPYKLSNVSFVWTKNLKKRMMISIVLSEHFFLLKKKSQIYYLV